MDVGLDGLFLVVRRIDSGYERRREGRFDAHIDSKEPLAVNTTLTDIRRQIA